MSVDINALASDFGCSTDDVKVMLSEIVVSLDDIYVAIEALLGENDCGAVAELGGMVQAKINHFHIKDMDVAAASLVEAANAGNAAGCQASFASLQAVLNEVKGLI
ncbi:MAG: hypothetical protein KU38_09580 [Sulfurovum sp. FS08-3]|nr:MAG: hypothetical protein KU38_09580 [Sulfurovum sp. FS08-3]